MSSVQHKEISAFVGLRGSFVDASLPIKSEIDSDLELIKGKASQLALAMFGQQEVIFGQSPAAKFSSIFSQELYGPGFTKGISTIFAYLICLEEMDFEGKSERIIKFSTEVQELAETIFSKISSGNHKLSEVRKQAEQLDNYGGYYNRTLLNADTAKKLIPEGILKCLLEIDPHSGHLVARITPNLSEQLLELYRSEIETYLADEGKNNLKLPYNLGIVTVAYKDELASISKEKVEAILQPDRQISLLFKAPYVVPVRGDNRYTLVACILIESMDITNLRKELSLGELYSEGRPLRYTFGAVYNQSACGNDELIQKMRSCQRLTQWMQFIDTKVQPK